MTRPKPDWRPPLRDGVSASRVGVGGGPWRCVLDFLQARLPTVDDWPQRLAGGDVLDRHGQAVAANAPCGPGLWFWYWRRPAPERRVPFEVVVLHQDAHLVVVDKPHFMPVTPGGRHLHETVLVRLRQQLGIDTLAPMHRLDRETAGVMVFTVQPGERHAYQSLLRDRQVRKVYEAVAPWRDDLALPLTCSSRLEPQDGAAFMQMRVLDGEPNAQTRIELIRPAPAAAPGGADRPAEERLALYRLTPLTGRKHQLRAQLCALGLPIVGDRIYPRLWPEPPPDAEPDYALPLQLLARTLSFVDPISGETRCFTSRQQLLLAA